MNYYKRYMADYARKTARLTLAQHGAYCLLLDEAYTTERPLPVEHEELFRVCRAMTKAEQDAVRFVADIFFPVGPDGKRHNQKVEDEIMEAAPAIEAAKLNGKRGGRPPKNKPTGFPENNPVGFETITQKEPSAKPSHISEEEEVAKATLSGSLIPPCPVDRLIDSYAKTLPTMPQPRRRLFKAGKSVDSLRARWRWVLSEKYESGERQGQRMALSEDEGVQWFERFFAYVAKSEFLTGKKGDWSGCNLGWLVTRSRFESVLSGAYHHAERAVA